MVQRMAFGLEVLDRAAGNASPIREFTLGPIDQSASGPALRREENFCVRHLAYPGFITHIG